MSAVLAAAPVACEGPDPAASSFVLPPTASSALAATGETTGSTGTTSTTEPVQEDSSTSSTFACLAQVGLSGGDKLGEALAAAVGPAINAPSGCNEGFLRDDALLRVTFIANTPDIDSDGKPKLWAEAITKAKNGDSDAAVMFSTQKRGCHPWDRVCDLVEYFFPYWHIAANEDTDYRPAFEVAIDRVGQACSAFIPK